MRFVTGVRDRLEGGRVGGYRGGGGVDVCRNVGRG